MRNDKRNVRRKLGVAYRYRLENMQLGRAPREKKTSLTRDFAARNANDKVSRGSIDSRATELMWDPRDRERVHAHARTHAGAASN